MKIYVDSEYHCHVNAPDGMYQEVDISEFDGKCQTFIEGYCYDTSNGYIQIYPWKPYYELYIAQLEYELADADAALNELGVTFDG